MGAQIEGVTIGAIVSPAVADWLKSTGGENFRSMRGQAAAILTDAWRKATGNVEAEPVEEAAEK